MKWEESDIRVGEVDIHVRRGGVAGGPPLVLAHGFSDDGGCWAAFAELLADRVEIIAVDSRNHGRSARAAGAQLALADDLAGVIRSLELQRPTLLGHSVGASTVAQVAGREPHLVGRVVLEDPPWRMDENVAPTSEPKFEGIRSWIASFDGLTITELEELGRSQHPTWSPAEIEPWARAKTGLGELAVGHLLPFDWRAATAGIRCPVLVVMGEAGSDAIAGPELAEHLLGLGNHWTTGQVLGAGHNIRRENLSGFAALTVPFILAEHDVETGTGDTI